MKLLILISLVSIIQAKERILLKAWMKYVVHDISNNYVRKGFMENTDFVPQANVSPSDFDEDGAFFIPKGKLIAFNQGPQRLHEQYGKVGLALRLLPMFTPIKPDHSIEDLGKFEEGYCFRLNFGMKAGLWTLCTDNPKTKDVWFGAIKDLAPNFIFDKSRNRQENPYLTETNMTYLAKSLNFSNMSKPETLNTNPPVPKESHWLVLQSWTPCSLECGGGQSFLQRKCVQGSDSASKCRGPALLVKECNSQACSNTVTVNLPDTNSPSTTFKYVRISERPQRFEKCVVKEGDMMLQQDFETQGIIKFPVRVVLNNQTLSIFSSGVALE